MTTTLPHPQRGSQAALDHPPPRIDTPRLRLRAHTLADFDDLHAMWSDPAVTAHIAAPATRTEAWARLLRYRGLWPLLGFGYWAVHDRATGRFAGDVGFGDFHRDLEPPLGGTPEAGWVFASWAHGQGYAAEAAQAAFRWLDAGPHAASACLIRPENAPSLRLAARLGFTPGPTIRHGAHDTVVLRRTRGSPPTLLP